jgi:hypothetical protein
MSAGNPDVVEVYLRLPPADIAYVKFVFESYEGVAVVRTVDRAAAVIVLLIAADLEDEARAILESLRGEVAWQEIAPPAGDLTRG